MEMNFRLFILCLKSKIIIIIFSGYMAPEYVTRGHFSIKSDVFSFGVLVLEIISGQKNNSFRIGEEAEDLLTYVSNNLHILY